MRRGAARWAALAAGFAASCALTGWAALRTLDRAQVSYQRLDLDVGTYLGNVLKATASRPRGSPQVVFLGDSLAMDVRPPDTSVPAQLEAVLRARRKGEPVRLSRVVDAGLGSFSHYLLSEEVARTDPDVVVLSLNLRWFSPAWTGIERAELVGWLPSGCWAEAATLPLHRIGVSADLALFYRALVRSGAVEAWRWLRLEQVRMTQAYWDLAEAIQRRSGAPGGLEWRRIHEAVALGDRTREGRITRQFARRALGEVFDGIASDHPALLMLDGALGRLCRDGTDCIVFVPPMNVEQFTRLGVFDAAGLGRTLEVVQALALRHGAVFLDLHDLLPDAAFSDFLDHFPSNDLIDGPALVAERVAWHVRRALRERRPAAPSRGAGRDPSVRPPQRAP